MDRERFERRYRAKLDRLGVQAVADLIRGVAGEQGVVLLCYEDVGKEGVWCHRTMFAAGWREQVGEVISEL